MSDIQKKFYVLRAISGKENNCLLYTSSTRVDQSALTEMIFTDSIPYAKKCEKVKVLSVADMFAEAIRRVCSGESISSLYTI